METSTNPPGRFYNHHWEHPPDSPYYKYGGTKEFAGNECSPEYTPFLKGWSAAKQIREGDLLLYYCTDPKQDVRYLLRARCDAYQPKIPDYPWKMQGDYDLLFIFQNPLLLREMRADKTLQNWKAINAFYRGTAFTVKDWSAWKRIHELLAVKNPSYPAALEKKGVDLGFVWPDSVIVSPSAKDEDFIEGSAKRVTRNSHERNPKAREDCKRIHGLDCSVCGFNFQDAYGDLGVGFIEVHHLNPISKASGPRKVSPKDDLRPVCPNCHRMIHRKKDALSIKELRQIFSQQKRSNG